MTDNETFYHSVTVPTKEFVGFIQSILSVYRGGSSLTIHKDYIDALVLSEDNASIILYAKIMLLANSKPDNEHTLHVRDLSKFILLSEFSQEDTFTFKVANNGVFYVNKKIKSAKFVLDQCPSRKTNKNINVEWFNKFTPHFKTQILRAALKEVARLSVFANDSDKVYIYEEDNSVILELNDRQKMNVDTMKVVLTNEYEGHILDKIILDRNTLATLSNINDNITMEVSKIQNHEALFFTIQAGGVLLRYLFASKIR